MGGRRRENIRGISAEIWLAWWIYATRDAFVRGATQARICLGRMDNWKKGDDYMLEKKGNGGEFEWKIMVEPHLWFVSCLCFWRGRCFCLCCLLGRKMYIVHSTQIGPTLSLISISPGYSSWQGWWTRGQHNIISYLLILYILNNVIHIPDN